LVATEVKCGVAGVMALKICPVLHVTISLRLASWLASWLASSLPSLFQGQPLTSWRLVSSCWTLWEEVDEDEPQ